MRNGASVSQLLQLSVLPRGARIRRLGSLRSAAWGVSAMAASIGERCVDYPPAGRWTGAARLSYWLSKTKRPASPGVARRTWRISVHGGIQPAQRIREVDRPGAVDVLTAVTTTRRVGALAL